MKKLVIAPTFTALCLTIFCSSSFAQIVQLIPGGGVHVRAPFVRVTVDGFGNSSVRAPFVNINPAGRYYPNSRQPQFQPVPNQYGQPIYPNSVGPNSVAPGQIPPTYPPNVPNGVPNSNSQNVGGNGINYGNSNTGSVEYGSSNSGSVNSDTANTNTPNNPLSTIGLYRNNSSGNSSNDGTVSVLDGNAVGGRPAGNNPSNLKPTPTAPQKRMSYRELRRSALAGATQLERDLDRFADGQKWKRLLRAGTVQDYFAEDINQPPDSEAMTTLQPILEYYDVVNNDVKYQNISRLGSFQAVRQTLNELLLPPIQRERKLLANSALELDAALNRFTTGKSWQAFLKLPESVFASASNSESELSSDLDGLKKALTRFDQSADNPKYEIVTRLAEYRAVHDHLAELVALLDDNSSRIEELPRGIDKGIGNDKGNDDTSDIGNGRGDDKNSDR